MAPFFCPANTFLIQFAGINSLYILPSLHYFISKDCVRKQQTTTKMTEATEVLALIGDSNVNRHLDSIKADNPSDHSLRQSHFIAAFNAIQL